MFKPGDIVNDYDPHNHHTYVYTLILENYLDEHEYKATHYFTGHTSAEPYEHDEGFGSVNLKYYKLVTDFFREE